MKFIKKNYLLLIIVDVSASTEAFVGTVCLIAVHIYDAHVRQPVRPRTEWRTAIRQTVPTKASVEAKMSTIINKRLFFNEFQELFNRPSYNLVYESLRWLLLTTFSAHCLY